MDLLLIGLSIMVVSGGYVAIYHYVLRNEIAELKESL